MCVNPTTYQTTATPQIYAAITDVPPTITREQLNKLVELSFPYIGSIGTEGTRINLSALRDRSGARPSGELYHKEGDPLYDQDYKRWEQHSKSRYVPMSWKEFVSKVSTQLQPRIEEIQNRVYRGNTDLD